MASAVVTQMYNDIRDNYGGNVADYFEEEYYTGIADTTCIATACEISFPNGGASDSLELEVVFQSASFQSGDQLGVVILKWTQDEAFYDSSVNEYYINVLEVSNGRVKCTIQRILNQLWFNSYWPVLLVFLTENDNAQSQAGEARVLSPAGVSVVTSFDPLPSGGEKLATPTGLNADQITSSGATISWTAVENASSYKVEYRRQGDTTWNE